MFENQYNELLADLSEGTIDSDGFLDAIEAGVSERLDSHTALAECDKFGQFRHSRHLNPTS